MTGRLTAIVVAIVLLAPGIGWAGECAGCVEARSTNGWCDACDVGYVGDVRISSSRLWHTLDAHGHRIDLNRLEPECRKAAEADGFCASQRMGFVNGEAYFSRLTWLLARAEQRDPGEQACPHAAAGSWCEACGVGRVGRYSLSDRTDFENLLHDLAILEVANETAARCDRCAAAVVTNTQCSVCRIRYDDGKPVGAGSTAPKGGTP